MKIEVDNVSTEFLYSDYSESGPVSMGQSHPQDKTRQDKIIKGSTITRCANITMDNNRLRQKANSPGTNELFYKKQMHTGRDGTNVSTSVNYRSNLRLLRLIWLKIGGFDSRPLPRSLEVCNDPPGGVCWVYAVKHHDRASPRVMTNPIEMYF